MFQSLLNRLWSLSRHARITVSCAINRRRRD